MALQIRAAAIKNPADLRVALQNATRLELATLPTYLTAMYSIKDGSNQEIYTLIRSVVMEEMLHFALAANVLNAIGGTPDFNSPGFPPTYPGPLPLGIGDVQVTLRKLSLQQVHDVFMAIEEPEDPIEFQKFVAAFAAPGAEPEEYKTIGAFYHAIERKLYQYRDTIFTGDPKLQVTGIFPQLIAVKNYDTAAQAINTIVRQGEGTSKSPLESPRGELAHFYRFEEIYKGKQLVKDPNAPNGYSFSGPPIVFDPNGVYPMADDPNTKTLPPDSRAYFLSRQFNYTFTTLLNALQETFTGQPSHLDPAIGIMFSLRLQAQALMQTALPGSTATAGPAWQYQPVE